MPKRAELGRASWKAEERRLQFCLVRYSWLTSVHRPFVGCTALGGGRDGLPSYAIEEVDGLTSYVPSYSFFSGKSHEDSAR